MTNPTGIPAREPALRVCTWNVLRKERKRRQNLLSESLRQIDAEVICLQETSRAHSQSLADELGLHHSYAGSASQREPDDIGVAVLSKLPFSRTQSYELSPAVHENLEGRALLLTAIQIGERERIFGSVHLSHTHLAGSLALSHSYRHTVLVPPTVSDITDPGSITPLDTFLSGWGNCMNCSASWMSSMRRVTKETGQDLAPPGR